MAFPKSIRVHTPPLLAACPTADDCWGGGRPGPVPLGLVLSAVACGGSGCVEGCGRGG